MLTDGQGWPLNLFVLVDMRISLKYWADIFMSFQNIWCNSEQYVECSTNVGLQVTVSQSVWPLISCLMIFQFQFSQGDFFKLLCSYTKVQLADYPAFSFCHLFDCV